MLGENERIVFFLYAVSAALAFLLALACKHRWQFSIRSLLLFTAWLALLLGWLQPNLSILLAAKWHLLFLLLLLVWPSLAFWIMASVAIGQPRTRRAADTRASTFRRRRKGESVYRKQFFRDFPSVSYSFYIVVFYLIIEKIMWMLVGFTAGYAGWRQLVQGGESFPAVYQGVNVLLIAYVLMNVWGHFIAKRPRVSVGMALELLLATHLATRFILIVTCVW